MQKREGIFECVFASDGNEYPFHLRAWNEEEAELHLRDLLHEYGVRSPGTLLIRNLKGQVVRRADYSAPAARNASP